MQSNRCLNNYNFFKMEEQLNQTEKKTKNMAMGNNRLSPLSNYGRNLPLDFWN